MCVGVFGMRGLKDEDARRRKLFARAEYVVCKVLHKPNTRLSDSAARADRAALY